jgi:hypothetical protein
MALSSSSNEGLPRKLTAVGIIGEVYQLFTIYEKNWNCNDCGQENYASRFNEFNTFAIILIFSLILLVILSRPRCFRCKKAKPAGVNNYVMDPAFEALQSGQEIQWQEVIDPNSYQV